VENKKTENNNKEKTLDGTPQMSGRAPPGHSKLQDLSTGSAGVAFAASLPCNSASNALEGPPSQDDVSSLQKP